MKPQMNADEFFVEPLGRWPIESDGEPFNAAMG